MSLVQQLLILTGTDGNGCIGIDDVVVTVFHLLRSGADQTICTGQSVTLSGSGAVTYDWDNGITDNTAFTPTTTTTYTVTDRCQWLFCDTRCISYGGPSPTVDLGIDVVCDGTTQTLDAGSGHTNYLSTGATTYTMITSLERIV